VTKYRKALLQNGIDDFVKCAISYLAEQNDWKKHIFRSNGYFACSIGEVSSATIEKYIAEQG
jgi:REP element-mobilizing transposase RayT